MEAVMAWNRKTNTRVSSKNIIANPVGVKQSIAVLSFSLLLAACGGDSGSGAKGSEPAEGADDGREVATLVDMGRCTSEREGDTVYVAEKLTDYLCKNNSWVDLSEVSSDMSSGKTDSNTTSSSSKGTGSTDETDPSSSDSDTDTPEGFVQENISVTGVAQKGPFKFGSPLNLYELKKNLTPSGTVYKDEISSNKGDFVIPKVSLAYPYAKLEVRGLYRNEVTGEWSTDSMTLRVLTDFSEERTDVNINLLTHLEYDRALYLVQEKGYSVYAAKKQAAQEIMTAFEFATAVTYSEDFAIFQNEGVSATTSAGNATLLAISALVMGNRSDAEIQNTIDKFIADIKTDGEWNDRQTKATMADWAYDFDYSTIRSSVKSWNILDIPDYETYLDIYWNNVYGLGGCSVNRKDVVAPNSNKLSKNYNKYFICNGSQWDSATTFQKDTYEWATGKTGEFKKGNVTDSIYVYNGIKWEVSERETAIGLCGTSNVGVVSKFNGTYYICKNNAWGTATILEYDTYGLTGVEGDVKAGVVNKDKYYVYENGTWRVAANDQEIVLGVCTTAREGVVAEDGDTYYICKNNVWGEATLLEYDTYGLTGIDGDVKPGVINKDKYYVYENGAWRAAANDQEIALGICTTAREGVAAKVGDTYYICNSKKWKKTTLLECDTYENPCTSTNVGATTRGTMDNANMYYCTASGWISLMDGWSWDVPKEARLNPEITYGTMTDSRDGKVYKTVTITPAGTGNSQTWMAENLNYADSVTTASLKGRSWCYNNVDKNCDMAGRLYTWAAAIDSVKLATDAENPLDCGYGKTCGLSGKVQGICPTGWHLPSSSEWNALFTAVGGSSTAGTQLKSTTGWDNSGNGTDAFGFSALPAGFYFYGNFYNDGYSAYFWSSTEGDGYLAYRMYLDYDPDYAYLRYLDKVYGFSVRCLRD